MIVAAISSKVGIKPKLPTHYFINAECGLERPSIVLMEQIRALDISRSTAYLLIKRKLFKSVKVGKQIRISRKNFDEWLDTF